MSKYGKYNVKLNNVDYSLHESDTKIKCKNCILQCGTKDFCYNKTIMCNRGNCEIYCNKRKSCNLLEIKIRKNANAFLYCKYDCNYMKINIYGELIHINDALSIKNEYYLYSNASLYLNINNTISNKIFYYKFSNYYILTTLFPYEKKKKNETIYTCTSFFFSFFFCTRTKSLDNNSNFDITYFNYIKLNKNKNKSNSESIIAIVSTLVFLGLCICLIWCEWCLYVQQQKRKKKKDIQYTKANKKDKIEKSQEIQLTDTKINVKIPLPNNNNDFPSVQQSEEWLMNPVDENIVQETSLTKF